MSVDSANVWKDFYAEFSQLASEEAHIVRARMKDDYLYASCTYKRDDVVLHERGRPAQGPFCLLNMPSCGIWHVSSGVSENFQERFRTLASRAGVVLECPEGTVPEDFWLHSLFHDLLENRSDLLFAAAKEEGGMIRRVCEASATFCARLERKALEHAIGTGRKTDTAEFQHSDDYCSVSCQGQSYSLTKSAGLIVRMLHEAHQKGKAGVGSTQIMRQLGCGQLWDQFRRRDGRKFWKALIRRLGKDFFSLNLPSVSESEHRRRR